MFVRISDVHLFTFLPGTTNMRSKRKTGTGNSSDGDKGRKKNADNAGEDAHQGMLTKMSNTTTSQKYKGAAKLKEKGQMTLFGSGCLAIKREAAMIGEEILMDESIWDGEVPVGMAGRLFKYRVDSYSESKQTFTLCYMEQSIKSEGVEWISQPDDSNDSSGKVLNNVGKSDVMSSYGRMQDTMKKMREHRARKKEVLRASLNNKKDVPMNESAVDISDLIKAANKDRTLGWKVDKVIEVQCIVTL